MMLIKIFQPLFTTIPIAIGIGMKVGTSEGEGGEFIIQLSVNKAE